MGPTQCQLVRGEPLQLDHRPGQYLEQPRLHRVGTAHAVAGAENADLPKPSAQTLMREALATADGLEVIMQIVSVPPNTTLPKHFHPGEEFIYVLEGSSILWREGAGNRVLRAGDSAKIDKGHVHTAITTTEHLKALVMRIHVVGEPMRTLVE